MTPFRVVHPLEASYPPLLLPLDDRPKKLFMVGTGVTTKDKCIAVIGTRKMTSYGKAATRRFVQDLISVGFTIVSGLALGVDGEAHRTALEAGGKTIAVIPSGVAEIAPIEHRGLAASIVQAGGALYSEYEPHVPALKHHFHVRNRIIAGMCMGVVVIEAGERSGTSLTVQHAGNYGRPVFAIPGPWTSPYSEGTKAMVNMGAKLVTNVQDILDEYHGTDKRGRQQPLMHETLAEEKVYTICEQHGTISLNALLHFTGFPVQEIQTALTTLELRGLIQRQLGEYMLA